jgi:hypothetical protein
MEVSFRELFFRRLGSCCPNLYLFACVIYLCRKIVSYKLNFQFFMFFVCRPMAVGDHEDDIVWSRWGTNGWSDIGCSSGEEVWRQTAWTSWIPTTMTPCTRYLTCSQPSLQDSVSPILLWSSLASHDNLVAKQLPLSSAKLFFDLVHMFFRSKQNNLLRNWCCFLWQMGRAAFPLTM